MKLPAYYLADDFTQYEDLIAKYGTRRKILKGSVLYGATSPQHLSYYIISGIARLSVINEEGRESIICFFGKGSIYPVNCMETSFTYEEYMELTAVTDLEVIEYRSDRILEMIEEDTGLAAAAIYRYNRYSIILVSKILMATYNNSLQLLSSFLYLFEMQKDKEEIHMTQEDLGKITGISLSHTTRAIRILKEEGVIKTHRGRIEVLDFDLLKAYCGGVVEE